MLLACSGLLRRYNNKFTSNFLGGHRLNILREYESENICYTEKKRLLIDSYSGWGAVKKARNTAYIHMPSRGFVLKPGATIAYPRRVLNL